MENKWIDNSDGEIRFPEFSEFSAEFPRIFRNEGLNVPVPLYCKRNAKRAKRVQNRTENG